jgi:hypothetical protein
MKRAREKLRAPIQLRIPSQVKELLGSGLAMLGKKRKGDDNLAANPVRKELIIERKIQVKLWN